MKLCLTPGCSAVVRKGRCTAHGGPRKAWRPVHGVPDRLRGKANQLRRHRVLARNPFCVECQQQQVVRLARIVDHIIPLAEHGADIESNLQGLCEEHSRLKSQVEARRGRVRHS